MAVGNYLLPDMNNGFGYLEALKRVTRGDIIARVCLKDVKFCFSLFSHVIEEFGEIGLGP